MGASKSTLQQLIFLALNNRNNTIQSSKGAAKQSQIDQAFAKDLATAIDTYIKMHIITVPPGQTVITAGSPAAQTGVTTTPLVTNLTML